MGDRGERFVPFEGDGGYVAMTKLADGESDKVMSEA